MATPKSPSRVRRAFDTSVDALSDVFSARSVGKHLDSAENSRRQAVTVQRKRVRRQLEAEYAHKEANMPPSQSQTMAQTMEKARKNGVTSSGKGVGY